MQYESYLHIQQNKKAPKRVLIYVGGERGTLLSGKSMHLLN